MTRLPPIRAELEGSTTCSAMGLVARGTHTPVLRLCRMLVEAGQDSSRPMHVWRGGTLALKVRSIGEAAGLTVREPDRGRAQFAPWTPFAPTLVAPPIAPSEPGGAEIASSSEKRTSEGTVR